MHKHTNFGQEQIGKFDVNDNESMAPFHIISANQFGDGGVMVWLIFISLSLLDSDFKDLMLCKNYW